MCPMNPRLLRPLAGGVHPEADAWRTAVVANGGSVSAATVKAVSKFCADIDAAGIRDRFFRLSLMCGDNLSAVLVPLYRGQSRTGTQHGNATDTNVGAFVSDDYSPTNGLRGRSGKALETGLGNATITSLIADIGFGAYVPIDQNAICPIMGFDNFNTPANPLNCRVWRVSNGTVRYSANGVTYDEPSASVSVVNGRFLTVSRSSGTTTLYINGTSAATDSTGPPISQTGETFAVLAFKRGATYTDAVNVNLTVGAYHIGTSLTNAQASSLNNAMKTFQQAIGRP